MLFALVINRELPHEKTKILQKTSPERQVTRTIVTAQKERCILIIMNRRIEYRSG